MTVVNKWVTPSMYDKRLCWHFDSTGLPCLRKSQWLDQWCDEHRPPDSPVSIRRLRRTVLEEVPGTGRDSALALSEPSESVGPGG